MKKLIALILVIAALVSFASCSPLLDSASITCDMVIEAYADAGYYLEAHIHKNEGEGDFGEYCSLAFHSYPNGEAPAEAFEANSGFIYIYFFSSADKAKAYLDENSYNIGIWLVSLAMGEYRWLRSDRYGNITYQYFNNDMAKPMKSLIRGATY